MHTLFCYKYDAIILHYRLLHFNSSKFYKKRNAQCYSIFYIMPYTWISYTLSSKIPSTLNESILICPFSFLPVREQLTLGGRKRKEILGQFLWFFFFFSPCSPHERKLFICCYSGITGDWYSSPPDSAWSSDFKTAFHILEARLSSYWTACFQQKPFSGHYIWSLYLEYIKYTQFW